MSKQNPGRTPVPALPIVSGATDVCRIAGWWGNAPDLPNVSSNAPPSRPRRATVHGVVFDIFPDRLTALGRPPARSTGSRCPRWPARRLPVRSASWHSCRRRDAARSRAIARSRIPGCRASSFGRRAVVDVTKCGSVASLPADPRGPADDCPETKTSVACRRDGRSRRRLGVPQSDPPVWAEWFFEMSSGLMPAGCSFNSSKAQSRGMPRAIATALLLNSYDRFLSTASKMMFASPKAMAIPVGGSQITCALVMTMRSSLTLGSLAGKRSRRRTRKPVPSLPSAT